MASPLRRCPARSSVKEKLKIFEFKPEMLKLTGKDLKTPSEMGFGFGMRVKVSEEEPRLNLQEKPKEPETTGVTIERRSSVRERLKILEFSQKKKNEQEVEFAQFEVAEEVPTEECYVNTMEFDIEAEEDAEAEMESKMEAETANKCGPTEAEM